MSQQILITLIQMNSSDIEAATIRQLIDLELERCTTCNQTFEESDHLPFHCHHCFRLRDERWLRELTNRARSLLKCGYFGSAA